MHQHHGVSSQIIHTKVESSQNSTESRKTKTINKMGEIQRTHPQHKAPQKTQICESLKYIMFPPIMKKMSVSLTGVCDFLMAQY